MENLEFIMMTTSFGNRDVEKYKKVIPNLHLCVDHNHDAMGNFLTSMNYTENPAVHLEDDIILCDNFLEKVTEAVEQYPDHVINFFSLRKEDYEVGKPRLVRGSAFMMNQCFYIPAGLGPKLAEYYSNWKQKSIHPTGYDIMMADYMKEHKMKYVQWFPHLVNHEECKSLINPKRSSKRTDKLFKK